MLHREKGRSKWSNISKCNAIPFILSYRAGIAFHMEIRRISSILRFVITRFWNGKKETDDKENSRILLYLS